MYHAWFFFVEILNAHVVCFLRVCRGPLSLELPRQSASLEEAKAARNDFMVAFVNEVSATHKGSESEAWRRVGVQGFA